MGFEFPIVRVEVERMRCGIMSAIADHNEEISRAVDAALTKAIEDLDWGGMIRAEIDRQMRDIVGSSVRGVLAFEFSAFVRNMFRRGINAALERVGPVDLETD